MILSGLARGVDAVADCGAIAAKGKTVAVFGTGIDVIFAKENRNLVEQLLSHDGAVISEFPSALRQPRKFFLSVIELTAESPSVCW